MSGIGEVEKVKYWKGKKQEEEEGEEGVFEARRK